MSVGDVAQVLRKKYPKANVFTMGTDEAVAVIQEGYAVAVIGPGGTRPHFHLQVEEFYRVMEGSCPLAVRMGGGGQVLRSEDEHGIRILCGTIHNAAGVGGWAWVEVRSSPTWFKGDHFEV